LFRVCKPLGFNVALVKKNLSKKEAKKYTK